MDSKQENNLPSKPLSRRLGCKLKERPEAAAEAAATEDAKAAKAEIAKAVAADNAAAEKEAAEKKAAEKKAADALDLAEREEQAIYYCQCTSGSCNMYICNLPKKQERYAGECLFKLSDDMRKMLQIVHGK
jgi:transcription initiation factor IIF auxiliary subunit